MVKHNETLQPLAIEPRYSDFSVKYLVDETLREGVERCVFATPDEDKRELLQAMLAGGLREFVMGCGPERLDLLVHSLRLQERGEIPEDARFVHIVLLNCWDVAYENFKRIPRELIGRITFSFGMIDLANKTTRFEEVVDRFVRLGAKSLKASILNNFSDGVGEEEYAKICEQIDRCVALGIPVVRINDSLGKLFPDATAALCSNLVADYPDLTFCLHAHNDRGLALANTLVSIQHGFTMVEASVGGLGNRSGITDMTALVKACMERNIQLGHVPLDLDKLIKAAHLAEEAYMAFPSAYRPVSGKLIDCVNFGVLNIPDYLKAPGARDYFISYPGMHPDTVKGLLRKANFSEGQLEDALLIQRVTAALTERMERIHAVKNLEYRDLIKKMDRLYSATKLSANDLHAIVEQCMEAAA
jgi:2-isopropylmalate synthase